MHPEPRVARERWQRSVRRQTLLVTVATVVGTLLLSVAWVTSAGPRSWRVALTARPETGTVVPLAGYAFVAVPPNALTRSARVTIQRASAENLPSVIGPDFRPVGDPFATMIDGRLFDEATVSARFDGTGIYGRDAQASVLLAVTGPSERRWTAVPASVIGANREVSAQTTARAATWRPFALDPRRIAARIGTAWVRLYAHRAMRVPPPRCGPGEPVRVTELSLGALPACAVRIGDRLELRVVNDRGYGVVVTPPFGVTVRRETTGRSPSDERVALGDLITQGDGTYLPDGMSATLSVSRSAKMTVTVGPSASSLSADFLAAAEGAFSSAHLAVFAPASTQAHQLAECSKLFSDSVGRGPVPTPAQYFFLERSCLVKTSVGIPPAVATFSMTPAPDGPNTAPWLADWRFTAPSPTTPVVTLSGLTTTLAVGSG
jgi:hypothetical protein